VEKVKNVPLILFCLLGVKSLVILPSITDVGMGILFCSALMFLEREAKSKRNSVLKEEITQLQKNVKELQEQTESLKTSLSTIKIAQNYRQGVR